MAARNLMQIPLNLLIDHARNAHITTKRERQKIANNIRRTGRYPPLTVRQLTSDSEWYPGQDGYYQILDGHQRRLIFLELVEEGLEQFALVACDDWTPITDHESLILLATLNSWGGNVPRRRAELLHAITKLTEMRDAESILPESSREIQDALKLLHQPVADIKRLVDKAKEPDLVMISFVISTDRQAAHAKFVAAAQLFATFYGATVVKSEFKQGGEEGRVAVLTFQVTNPGHDIIQEALRRAAAGLPPGTRNRRGVALEQLAKDYLALAIENETRVPVAQVEKQLNLSPERARAKTSRPKPAPTEVQQPVAAS